MSLSVEISSYVLLATLSATPTTADLGYASRIVRWLTSQQNSYGGFSSTQVQDLLYRGIQLYRGTTDLQYRRTTGLLYRGTTGLLYRGTTDLLYRGTTDLL